MTCLRALNKWCSSGLNPDGSGFSLAVDMRDWVRSHLPTHALLPSWKSWVPVGGAFSVPDILGSPLSSRFLRGAHK